MQSINITWIVFVLKHLMFVIFWNWIWHKVIQKIVMCDQHNNNHFLGYENFESLKDRNSRIIKSAFKDLELSCFGYVNLTTVYSIFRSSNRFLSSLNFHAAEMANHSIMWNGMWARAAPPPQRNARAARDDHMRELALFVNQLLASNNMQEYKNSLHWTRETV